MLRFLKWSVAVAMSGGISIPGIGSAAVGEVAVTCTNQTSGATWQIKIDYDRQTVDSNPAQISDTKIKWREKGGIHYTLDRKSGDLTRVLASSTAGHFLYDRCKLPN